jgi:hypothetical protein
MELVMFLLEKGANPFSNKVSNLQILINQYPATKTLFQKFRQVFYSFL